jgi:hypothetical protein
MFDAQLPMTFTDPLPPEPAKTVWHIKANDRRAAIKTAGGAEYEALLDYERAARAAFRKRHPGRVAETRRRYKKKKSFKANLCLRARARGRKRGIEATITAADLDWPTHCPVLGIELDYPLKCGMRGKERPQANWPSLDRFDPHKGYVPGNVFVISYRANTLKNNSTYEEILKIAKYLSRRLKGRS